MTFINATKLPIKRWSWRDCLPQNAQHCGILHSRANTVISSGYDQGGLSKMDMRAACLNLIQFGDVGLLKVRNGFGQVVKLIPSQSVFTQNERALSLFGA